MERKIPIFPVPTNNSKWDLRFLGLAKYISTFSKDPSTKVGAVIVRPDKTVCSLGYNGFPKKMRDTEELLNNREEKYSRIIHGEINALIHSREGVQGYTLYTYPFACCDRCAVQMIEAGISRFVNPKLPQDLQERWGKTLNKTVQYYGECSVGYTEYDYN